MSANATVNVRIDKRALDKVMLSRDGDVGHVIAAFAGQATKDVKGVFRERAGGEFWPVSSTITEGTAGVRLITTIKRSRPHTIVVKNATALVFFWEREGRMFAGPLVHHPGSAPPEKLILSGIERAGRRLVFTAAAPTVTGL